MGSLSDSIDFKIIFVAAFSSFITLLVLHIFNNYEYIYIQFQQYTTRLIHGNAEPATNIQSNNANLSQHVRMILPRKDTISVSESCISLLCKDMITEDFYLHEKIKNYYETDQYLNMIPRDPNWVHRKIKLLIPDAETYSEQLHQLMLDHFSVTKIESKSNKYIKEITQAIDTFNEWRKWGVGGKGWIFRKKTKHNMFVYTHSTPQYTLDIVKVEKILPFPVPVIIGVFFNEYHVRKMDPSIKGLIIKEKASLTCHIIHLFVKCPPFIADRDFLNCGSIYLFKDGSVLIVNTKCNDIHNTIAPVTKEYIRGEIILSIYDIRPNYDGNRNESRVTFYSLVDIKGSIPSWILNNAFMETAKSVPNLENYIQSLYDKKIIHKPGQLWIPPNPLLKMMSVDIN